MQVHLRRKAEQPVDNDINSDIILVGPRRRSGRRGGVRGARRREPGPGSLLPYDRGLANPVASTVEIGGTVSVPALAVVFPGISELKAFGVFVFAARQLQKMICRGSISKYA